MYTHIKFIGKKNNVSINLDNYYTYLILTHVC